MTATPEEILQINVMGQLRIINSILSISDKHVYYSETEKKNLLNGESFKKEIKEMGDKLKANYFPPYTP